VFAPVDLAVLIDEVVRLTRARWSDIPQQTGVVIELTQELAAGAPAIEGVEAEIRDSLTNLIFNAVDAMPSGGQLILRTRLLPAGRRNFPPPRLALEISDTGTGMDEDTRRRCLDPFFTTKGRGGTGLGLAMVYGMVQRHSATLEIDSELGKGTTFRICFAIPAAIMVNALTPTPHSPHIHPLRLLVIDDDPLILRSLRDVLIGDGHSIVTCPGGREGLTAFTAAQSRGERFDAVITDLGMPQIDGRIVAAAVKAAGNIPVILLTGWGRPMEEADLPRHVDLVLTKPPKLPDLRTALAQLCPSVKDCRC
jgi:CheY-like chemotaxis protein